MTHQIKTYKGKKYFVLPALEAGRCEGCVFHTSDNFDEDGVQSCPQNDMDSNHYEFCTGGDDFDTDLMWIPPTKKALAEYIAKKLEGPDEMG